MTTTPSSDAAEAFATQTKTYWADGIRPAAWGLGVATQRTVGYDRTILDVKFTNLNFDPAALSPLYGDTSKLNLGSLAAIMLGCGFTPYQEGYHFLQGEEIKAALEKLFPYTEEPEEQHPNIAELNKLLELNGGHLLANYSRVPLFFCLDDLTVEPKSAIDAYFRLHLLSGRFVQPHEVNLNGLFGLLSNNAWTNFGPVLPSDVEKLEWVAQKTNPLGPVVSVTSIDKFPRMTDYVRPSGVRIGDADRVRLGAHLASGTTVMHEGFVNFNAGTLGASMVEGRISAGVVVGNGTDIGGGASIMGTLSGGNKTIVSIGENCLLEAEAGLGIPIGDRTRVEAGLYVKSTTRVRISRTEPRWDENPIADHARKSVGGKGSAWTSVKAEQLSGISDAVFRRNSSDGAVEVIPRGDSIWGELSPQLHVN